MFLLKEDYIRERIIQWYDQHSASLFKYIIKMVKDVQQAEDLIIKAYQYLAQEQEIRNPRTFLYRIAHNLTVDYLRKRRPIYVMKNFLANKKDPTPSTEAIIENRENSNELYVILQYLKPAHRQVIILRKIEDFSVRETAEILNWTESKVKSTLLRALRNLKTQLTERVFISELSQRRFLSSSFIKTNE